MKEEGERERERGEKGSQGERERGNEGVARRRWWLRRPEAFSHCVSMSVCVCVSLCVCHCV